ncbi:hypothetical protein [Rhodococcus sp. NBC_00297]|uniref:hypothetical protein n=1 Tax=Rhodococcus sp. NBC_00297 TaxID=2976005 RepID=UPI002E27CF5E|nr:hypothetical protein [Rhodococcus sp. NBC_00297]
MTPPKSTVSTLLRFSPVRRYSERGKGLVEKRGGARDQFDDHLDIVTDGRPRKRAVADHPPGHNNSKRGLM